MKKITYASGQYSQIKLDDSSRVFVEILPEMVRAKKMILGIIPTKTIWEFVFPFYIRTAVEAWESSKIILNIILETIENVRGLEELKNVLENETSKALREYIKEHDEEARDISVDKVGMPAIKQILNPKSLQKTETIIHEYGKIIERVGLETMQKYPAVVYPQSLLPYPKEVIKKALEDGLWHIEDEKMRESIKFCLGSLVAFIDDDEANKRNSEMLKILAERNKNK
ncbi:hypothetical protein CVV26_02020 [Candidatus Kuenenbacteria bacterium HGW-Kuenenbacteria-1]|uniref:Uncharacterized protein n=1 Tax=Candidatus Kuenenbacteria bacterium HGW-Kuenenbacteria-1 TaxID=2013812 RepID=A0A2N1UNB1_9BACT|nr:MAG: hypothetical protein CVV26_02020 [Candidatus Kuenenbacteria bacterium HGW-Kuenenbacteria-1]